MRVNKEDQLKKRVLDQKKREEMWGFYAEIFGTKVGMVVMDDLLSRGHLFESTFLPGSSNSTVVFQEGQREMALHIVKMVNSADPSIIPRYSQKAAKFNE